jgi:uncharacterized cupredoxin-like copper-binding protein
MVNKLRATVLGVAVAGLALAGCESPRATSGSGMMGGSASSNAAGMSGGLGYHYSALSCSPPASLPGHTVRVTLADMGGTQMMGGTAPTGAHMMLRATPATVPAGQVSLVASNLGWRTHELVILPLSTGASAGQRVAGADGTVSEANSLGEASGNCAAGAGGGIPAKRVGWVTLTLAAGNYELVCNLPNHYADGMRQELTVS